MRHRHYCTYFDHRYLPRGLALHASLGSVGGAFTLWVLALDEEAARFLAAADLPGVRVVHLSELEDWDTALHAARADRSLVEFYFTCSPCLPRYLFARCGVDEVTYLDSDLYFFASPETLFDEMGAASVAIVPHRFAPKAAVTHARYGRYNVGWLTFRNDGDGRACLEWWRERCLEWCHDRVEGDRYADQKYLEQFHSLFDGVHDITHPGANLAPWNLARHAVAMQDGHVTVDGRELVFFHFQGLRQLSRRVYDSNLTSYGARLTPAISRGIFLPYLRALRQAEDFVFARLPQSATASGIRRRASGLRGYWLEAGRKVRALRAALAGNLIRMPV